ncbi:MAG: hypothetical protein ABEI52_05475 [Halobacteriaceae archaeon]
MIRGWETEYSSARCGGPEGEYVMDSEENIQMHNEIDALGRRSDERKGTDGLRIE